MTFRDKSQILHPMANALDITEKNIRKALIARATAYCDKTGSSFSAIGIAAVGDSKFLSRVMNPEIGFNIKTYQRMVEWLDKAERKLAKAVSA